jgi:TolB-like protein
MTWSIEKEPAMKRLSIGTVFVLLPVLFASCQGEAKPAAEEQPTEEPSIAVLPFDNLSSDPDDAYLSAAMHEEVLVNLARVPDLRVIARSSVQHYKDVTTPVSQIASELGVEYILEGAVRMSDDRVRITVQLINARTDEHLWAESFDREMTAESLFSIQQEIAAKVAEGVAALLESPASDSVH